MIGYALALPGLRIGGAQFDVNALLFASLFLILGYQSALFAVLQEASRRKVKVLITSDHGSIHCRTPATVFAKRDATQNLRYKFGEDLRAENPEQGLLFKNEDSLKLPRRGLGANTLLATGDTFFVYPTKLREYQSRYRGSFLHGGVTPEECILPVSLLTPRR